MSIRNAFDIYVELFNDPNSPLWTAEHGQRRGSATRVAFWDGFNGIRATEPKNSIGYACWAAGRNCAKNQSK